jgi:hypothetical protein
VQWALSSFIAYMALRGLTMLVSVLIYGEAVSYNHIKNILANNLDKDLTENQKRNSGKSHIPVHDNIRGPQAFK